MSSSWYTLSGFLPLTWPDKCEANTIHSSKSSETGLCDGMTYSNNNNNNVYNDLHKIPKDAASRRQRVVRLVWHLSERHPNGKTPGRLGPSKHS